MDKGICMLSATAIIGIINLVLIVLVAVINHLNHVKLTTNDLCHLSADVKSIAEKQIDIQKEVGDLKVDLAYVKGNCSLHTRKVVKKSKKNIKKV
jgi:hypothetical protein